MRLTPTCAFARWVSGCAVLLLVTEAATSAPQDADQSLLKNARAAMRKAATFYHDQVARNGGYVYYYSVDLSQRLGEGVARPEQIWVQPPGTPTVGLAYLAAYRATGEEYFREAAIETAEALMYGQLQSGGWQNSIEFDPSGGQNLYRNGKGGGKRNNSTLDDGISQAAIQLLVRLDQALDFEHEQIHESAAYALNSLLSAQFPNGGFPQVWSGPVDQQLSIVNANYPQYDWRTEGRIKEYWNLYTLNDSVAGTVFQTLKTAYEVYGDEAYMRAIKRLGDFLVLAQMPEPQPGWAQQYNYDMQPVWARKFEPPAVTGAESQDVLETLLAIARVTGDQAYLEPVPKGVAYLRKSLLPDGRLARYYELQSNRPLYMERHGKNYSLTYSDAQLPGHYGWKWDSRLNEIERAYQAAKQNREPQPKDAAVPIVHARRIIQELDDQGRWITTSRGESLPGQPKFRPGDKYISSGVFSENLTTLSEYVAASERP